MPRTNDSHGSSASSREMALVVIHSHPDPETQEILGIGRLRKIHGAEEAEFAIFVTDRVQGVDLAKNY